MRWGTVKQAVPLLLELSRRSGAAVLAIILLLLASPILNWATVMLTKYFIDALTGDELRPMLVLAGAMGAVAIAVALVSRLQSFTGDRLSLDIMFRMEEYLLTMMKPLHITKLETPQFQQDLHILKNSLFKINSFIQSGLNLLHQLLLIVVYTIMLLPYSVMASVIVFICSLTALLQVWKQTVRQERMFQAISQNEMEARHLNELILQPAAQKEMLVYATKPYLIDKWRRAAHYVLQVKSQFLKKDLSWELIVESVQPIGFFVIQLILLPKLAAQQMTVGDYVAMSGAVGYLAASWKTMFHSIAPFKGMQLFVQRFIHFRDTYFPQGDEPGKRLDKLHSVELNRLDFTYPTGGQLVLQQIQIRIQRGEMIALVGENGSGKSTLAKVIAGLHEVERGQVFVNGVDLCNIDRTGFYSRLAIVNQDYMRYPFSVYENIALAPRTEDSQSMDALLRKYPKLVPAQLRERLDTVLGYQYLNAKQLSGGQWQRIAIARALYKKAELLVLDEATAELDPRLEIPLIEQLRSQRRQQMTVIVTHNMHVAKLADRIYVLHEGMIAESGSHGTLLQQQGHYSAMWEQSNESKKKGDAEHVFA